MQNFAMKSNSKWSDFYTRSEMIINSKIKLEYTDKELEALAEKKRIYINNLPDTLKMSSNCKYISLDGSPDNDGSSPESAWDSLATLENNSAMLKPGDVVLFRRGDIFRGNVVAVSGVSYGAYGEGEKPRIYGSTRDYINDLWYQTDDGLWTLDVEFPADVGNIIFDSGKAVGVKRINRADIINSFDFWCDHENNNKVFIKLEHNPKEVFKSIEIAHNLWLFRLNRGTNNVNIENIAFGYCGGHGLRMTGSDNVTVQGCEFAFIGGCFLTEYKDGTVRYGNAVEVMYHGKNITVKDCIAHQIYDSGITHQGYGEYCAENLFFEENLLEYCGMGSIEYWLGKNSKCKNIFYKNNIMRFAGYGFGGIQRPDKNMSAHIQSNGNCINECENFNIENNIFELSSYDLVNAQSRAGTFPTFKGNTYIQEENGRLGSYSDNIDCFFDSNVKDTIIVSWGDKMAKICSSKILRKE